MNHEHPPHEAMWNETAESYARKAERLEPSLRAATDAMLAAVRIEPGTRLLDLACGPGHSTAAAHDRGADVLGLDLSAAVIAGARRRFPNVPFAIGDMTRPPPGPWDAITCRFGAHHADPAWLAAAYDALTPGGRLAIAEVVPPAEVHAGHGKVSAGEWSRRLEQAGFEDVTAERCNILLPSGPTEVAASAWPDTWIIAGRKPARE